MLNAMLEKYQVVQSWFMYIGYVLTVLAALSGVGYGFCTFKVNSLKDAIQKQKAQEVNNKIDHIVLTGNKIFNIVEKPSLVVANDEPDIVIDPTFMRSGKGYPKVNFNFYFRLVNKTCHSAKDIKITLITPHWKLDHISKLPTNQLLKTVYVIGPYETGPIIGTFNLRREYKTTDVSPTDFVKPSFPPNPKGFRLELEYLDSKNKVYNKSFDY